jgi:hypothetical protein
MEAIERTMSLRIPKGFFGRRFNKRFYVNTTTLCSLNSSFPVVADLVLASALLLLKTRSLFLKARACCILQTVSFRASKWLERSESCFRRDSSEDSSLSVHTVLLFRLLLRSYRLSFVLRSQLERMATKMAIMDPITCESIVLAISFRVSLPLRSAVPLSMEGAYCTDSCY